MTRLTRDERLKLYPDLIAKGVSPTTRILGNNAGVSNATVSKDLRSLGKTCPDSDLLPCFSLYRHYNAADELLYIGITVRGERRMREHAEDKNWWRDVAYTKYDHSFTDRASLEAAEQAAVIAENPLHNKKRYKKGKYPTDAEKRAAWLASKGIQTT